jgi:hypothetical protein
MGIEPTRNLIEPHTGFEDLERHQAAGHLPLETHSHPRTMPAIPARNRAGMSWTLTIRNTGRSPFLSVEIHISSEAEDSTPDG